MRCVPLCPEFLRPLLSLTGLSRALAAPLVAVALSAGAAQAQLTVVPTDVQQPGTQPNEVIALQPSSDCFACHANYDPAVEPGRNWEGSMMAHASRDPIFWAATAVAEQDFAGSADLCLRCHLGRGWADGRSTPTDGSAFTDVDADGVACDLCHRLTNPDESEWYGTQNAPYIANDGGSPKQGYYGGGMFALWGDLASKLGPYYDAQSPHPTQQSLYHRDSKLCGTCHDVSNPVVGDLAPGHGSFQPLAAGTFSGVAGTAVATKAAFNNEPASYGIVERTFSEHQASAFAALQVSSYTGLPAELQAGSIADAYAAAMASNPTGDYNDGEVRTFSCQTCHMPPVTGKGCALGGVPTRTDLPLHDLTGGNYWAPAAIAWLDANSGLQLGGGLSLPTLDAMTNGQDRARDNLEAAASLDVFGETLRVVNLTGHKLISGYPEGRRMWLNVRWYDDQSALLREDGAYGSVGISVAGQPSTVDSIIDLDDPNLVVFEAKHGLSQEWAVKLISLGTSPTLPLSYDRSTGAVTKTLVDLVADGPGSSHESFHFVLNDTVLGDNRIPPYGLSYDDALARNAVPTPATQYGNPGQGGVYRHWAEVDLSPPVGADHAEIDLLYQPTSWEYIEFLLLANTGAVANLASTGTDLTDAWFATGMAAPHVMASTTWTAGATVSPWSDLGNGLAGASGEPRLVGAGPAIGDQSVGISLENAAPNSSAFLVMGFSTAYLPAKGGVLVPSFDVFLAGLPINPEGTLSFVFPWPNTVPSGAPVVMQYWVPDAGAPVGLAASNGLKVVTP